MTAHLTDLRERVLLAVAAGTILRNPHLGNSYDTADGNRNVTRQTDWLWNADLIELHPRTGKWQLADAGQDALAAGVR